jgi:hypothetical protein
VYPELIDTPHILQHQIVAAKSAVLLTRVWTELESPEIFTVGNGAHTELYSHHLDFQSFLPNQCNFAVA